MGYHRFQSLNLEAPEARGSLEEAEKLCRQALKSSPCLRWGVKADSMLSFAVPGVVKL